MQIFVWFEGMLLRLRNPHTRRRALVNIFLFISIIGTATIAAIYVSSYVTSRAGFDAEPQHPPSIRLEYHSFAGPSAIYAISKKGMAYSQAKGFELGAKWWRNDVLAAAETLVDQLGIRPLYANALPNSTFNARVKDADGRELHAETYHSDSDPKALASAKKFFNLPTTREPVSVTEDIETALRTALDSPSMRVLVYRSAMTEPPSQSFDFNSYTVSGFAPRKLVAGRTGDRWTEVLIKKNPQYSDLVKYSAFFLHDSAVAMFEPRQIHLLAASIENIGNQPIYAPQFTIKRLRGALDGTLRTERSQESSLSGIEPEVAIPPLEAIKPGERFYVALALYMEFSRDGMPEFLDWQEFPADEATFDILTAATEQGAPVIRSITLNILPLKERSQLPETPNQRYYFGPTVEPISLSVERPTKATIDLRRYDPMNILLQDGDEKGSCPILFVGSGKSAIRLRPILVNAVTQAGREVDAIIVPNNSSEFELRELEAERTFIQGIRMIVELRSGSNLVYQPDPQLKSAGENGLVLDQGDSMRFRFQPSHDPRDEKSRRLEINGYYVPYALMRKSQPPNRTEQPQ